MAHEAEKEACLRSGKSLLILFLLLQHGHLILDLLLCVEVKKNSTKADWSIRASTAASLSDHQGPKRRNTLVQMQYWSGPDGGMCSPSLISHEFNLLFMRESFWGFFLHLLKVL